MRNKTIMSRILAGVLSAVLTFSVMPVSGFAEQVLEPADAEIEESLFSDESVQEEEDNDISEEQDWEENDENADLIVIEKNYQVYPNIPEDMQDVCGVNISTSSDDSVNVEVNIVDQKNKHYLIKSIRIGSKVLLNNPGGQLSYAENDIQITDDIADENGNVPVTVEGMECYTIEISYDSEKGQAYIEGREEEEYGTIEISEGEIPKLIVHAHEDYLISDILIDDESLEDCQDLTDYDTELTADKNYVIQVSFVSKQHTVISNLEDEQKGGSVNFRIDGTEEFIPSLSIEHGQNVTGRVQANNGYFISSVSIFSDKPTRSLKVEDMEKDANGGYLFDISDITGDVTVTAYFFEFPNVQLTLPDKDMNYSCYNSQVILTLNSNNLTYFSSGKYWIDGSEEIHELDMQERTIEINEDGQNIVICAELFTGNGQSITIKSESFSINSIEPEVIININGDQNSDAKDKYYCSSRTASIRIKDRKDTFPSIEKMLSYFTIQKNGEYLSDEEKAEIIQYNPDDTFDLDGRDGTDIFVTFEGDASYSWDFEYINLAGKKGKNNSTESKDVYEFFIDTTKPTGTITIGEQPSFERFINMITFGLFFSNSAEDITITSEDISPVKIEYYIRQGEFTNGITSDELEQDSETFWTEYTGSFSFTPQKKAKFVVYVRMIDAAGNHEYVSSNGYIFDEKKSMIKLEFDGIDESVIYTENIPVKLHVTDEPEENETVSGIKKVEYWLTTVESEEEITPEVLYSREDDEPLISEKKFEFEVKANIDSIIELHVRAEDNAGNIEEEIKVLNIDPAPPEISVTYYYEDETGNRVNIDGGAYFDGERIAVISIKERNFNQNQALDGITITSDLAGENKSNSIILSDVQSELEADPELKLGWTWETAETKWKKTGKNTYETAIIFSEDGTYKLNVDYEDNAGNHAEKNFEFTIDSIKPVGSVIINDNSQKMASQLLKKITFGIFSSQALTIEIKADSKKNTENKINIEYYLSQIQIGEEKQPLTLEELEAIEEWTAYMGKFSVNKDENYSNVVYARLTDMAGNVSYICSEGYIYDDTPCEITITPDKTNAVIRYDGTEEYAYYHENFTVDMEVNDYFPYSGIAYVKYALKVNGETVQSEEFFRGELDEETGKFLPTDEITEIGRNKECDEPWQQQILISKSYNSSNIELTVETKDFAGNEKIETFPFDIDTTAPEVEISYDNNIGNVFEGEWYFQNARTAVIQFTERREHFNREEAQKSISVTGAAGTYQFGDWTFTEGKAQNHDDDVFSIPVTFYGDSEYQIRIDYSDMAQNHNSEVSIGKDTVAPYAFMVDRTSPYGTITALSAEGREETWDDIVDRLYFGFWSKYGIQIFIEYGDASSPVKSVEYYKSLATNALTEEEIIKIKDWETFDTLTLSNNERCTIYLKITDAAGNSRYLSTHALIIDDSLPDGELMPPDISMTAEQAESGIYNGDVSVSITVDDPMVNNAYSGLQSVSYRVLNMGQETQSGTLYTFNIDDPQYNDLLKTWEGEVTVSGELNNSNDVVLEVYAQDNVLNASVETLSLSIDTTPPSISVSFNNNQVQNELFKDGRTARISIAERNFSKEYVNIVTTKDSVEYQASAVWEQSGGTGNGDNTVWYTDLPFSGDGDYTFSIDCSDLAANKSSQVIYVDGTVFPSEFTIDATIPDIRVEFTDKDFTPKGNYYKDERTAIITIDELHFNKEKASSGITVRGTDDGKSVNAVISEWKDNGTAHTATVVFAQDAKYYLNVSYTDEAGNAGKNFSTDFYVDNHDPELTISVNGDTTFNAYGKEKTIGTMIHYEDTNFDDQQVSISLSGIRVEVSEPEIKEDTIMFTLTRTNEITGKVENRTWSGTIEDIFKNGQLYGKTITFEDFPSDFNNPDDKMFDDIYTFYVQVTDKAGRISNAGNPDKNQFAFSVNRFGSTYNVSEEIKSVLKKVYVQEIGNVIVSEINPNELTKKSVVLFKNSQQITLKENVDYQVIAAGEEKEWHEYTYQINQNVFEDDGRYRIELQSIDKAGNNSTNVDMQDRSDNENESGIEFFMDKTPPTAVFAVKNGQLCRADGSEMTISMSASDNLKLSEVTVYVDEESTNKQIYQWDETKVKSDSSDDESTAESEPDSRDGEFMLAEIDTVSRDGDFTFKVSATPLGQIHQLKVICKDASGRENDPLIIEITAIDTSSPWFYLIMIGGIVLLIVLAVVIIRRKNTKIYSKASIS